MNSLRRMRTPPTARTAREATTSAAAIKGHQALVEVAGRDLLVVGSGPVPTWRSAMLLAVLSALPCGMALYVGHQIATLVFASSVCLVSHSTSDAGCQRTLAVLGGLR
jgi:hypothetical protein